MRKITCAVLTLGAFCGIWCESVSGQTKNGVPPFGSSAGGPETINLANLNVDISVPVRNKAGRGTNFTYAVNYDSLIWWPITSGGTKSWQPASSRWGWSGLQPAGFSYVLYSMTYISGNCGYMGQSSYQQWSFSNFSFYDPFGTWHSFSGMSGTYFNSPGGTSCPPNGAQPPTEPISQTAADGSGYTLYVSIAQYPTAY